MTDRDEVASLLTTILFTASSTTCGSLNGVIGRKCTKYSGRFPFDLSFSIICTKHSKSVDLSLKVFSGR